jgi:hypothetical protein
MTVLAAVEGPRRWAPENSIGDVIVVVDRAAEDATPYQSAVAPQPGAPGVVGIAGMLGTLSPDALRHALAETAPQVLGEAIDGMGEGHVRALLRTAAAGLDSEGLLAAIDDHITQLGSRILDATVPDAVLHDSVAALQRLADRLDGEKLRRVRGIVTRQSSVTEAARTTVDLLTRFGLTRGEAREQVETATALADMPRTAKKVADGELSARSASEVARKRREMEDLATAAGADAAALARQRDALDDAAAATAPHTDRRKLRGQLDDFAAEHAPEQLADRERRAHRNRRLRITPGRNGTATIEAYGPAAAIATFAATIDALARPTNAQDTRTLQQRSFDALVHLSERYLAEGALPEVAAAQAHINVTIPHGALHDVAGAEPGHLDGFGAISNATARMLCCDAEITFIITDDHGEPLNLGRTTRTPTRAQRRGVIARDRACIGCGAPASRCQIHHIRWWRHGGSTDLTNLVLLCWNCHTHVHHHRWQITQDDDGQRHAGPPGTTPGRHLDTDPRQRT